MLEHFNTGLDSFLTEEELRAKVPVAFLKQPTSKVSEHYVFADTMTLVEDLGKLGWRPVTASQRKQKGEKPSQFSKHMISFQNENLMIRGENGDDSYVRLIMTNSHDGTQAFKFRLGIYRLVCSNGLVVADEEFSSFRIAHKGYSFEELRRMVITAVGELPAKVEVMNKMKEKELTYDEQSNLVIKALTLRYDEQSYKEGKWLPYDKETIDAVLEPKREADKGDDLWLILNRIQETVIKGGLYVAKEGEKARKMRAIKSFEKDLYVNQELFKLAAAMVM